jgi:high affinity Mn2+ porin
MSAGLQVSGAHWSRAEDRLGIACVRHLLSADHRDYLAAGGNGFLLGDGRLNCGPEQIAEAYYRIQLGRYVQISPDWQLIQNPGYNRDRGPATVVSLRLRAAF